METYFGVVQSTHDCLILFEACRQGVLKRVRQRLTDSERDKVIRSGAIFIWDEEESGIKRWTDGRSWSPSRIQGSFLVYREICKEALDSPDVPKVDGLIKKSLSVRTSLSRKLHIVSYITREDLESEKLQSPRTSSSLASISLREELYPEFNVAGGSLSTEIPLKYPWSTGGSYSQTLKHNSEDMRNDQTAGFGGWQTSQNSSSGSNSNVVHATSWDHDHFMEPHHYYPPDASRDRLHGNFKRKRFEDMSRTRPVTKYSKSYFDRPCVEDGVEERELNHVEHYHPRMPAAPWVRERHFCEMDHSYGPTVPAGLLYDGQARHFHHWRAPEMPLGSCDTRLLTRPTLANFHIGDNNRMPASIVSHSTADNSRRSYGFTETLSYRGRYESHHKLRSETLETEPHLSFMSDEHPQERRLSGECSLYHSFPEEGKAI
ncbi:Gti1/Pac2 family-domain-containing protein [Cladochytrium replicatum]|nr:Gti1/Pac2 family-domain-containing protein [Cladochytrium replicatum]